MNTTEYIGEHLFIGQIGNAFVLLSFVCAIVATIAYFFASKENESSASWKNIARTSFRLHSVAVFGIAGTLFYMLYNHMYEYHYVWQHSNSKMPLKYILSCFWEGQEGSFLLWTIWHVILGNILIKTSKEWEAPVMTVFASVQVFLASMLLGIYIGNYNIGSNPFTVLLRQHPDFSNLPFVQLPTYLESLDGRGLNPLLQNYWMTIHPPTLFLGFASTLIPFCYAIAGLWKKRLTDWQKHALPWSFFGIMILGTGILMGGAWAYEALSFGGFWAWDPVENASLVPWLTFVGSAHVLMINKNRGDSLLTAFLLTIITFILILYSTFLTRSGILGDSSVHAFTDLGMSGQLLLYLLFYVVIAIILIIRNRRELISQKQKEEHIWSREFWMFVGALVLLISSFQIIYTTSIPVTKKILSVIPYLQDIERIKNMAPPAKLIEHYNAWQIPFAIIVCLLIAVTQFFKYKKGDIKIFLKKIYISFFVAVILSGLFAWALSLTQLFYILLLFATTFAVIANWTYMVSVLKGKIKKAGASIAHIGFALIMMGALISTSKQQTISQNSSRTSVESLSKDFSNNKNILLSINDTLKMGDYYISYSGKDQQGVNIYFNVDYFTKDEKGNYQHEFRLRPLVQTNPRMGNIAEPDTRHMLHKDIYSHIAYADLDLVIGDQSKKDDYTEPHNEMLSVHDTTFSSNSIIILDSLSLAVDKKSLSLADSTIAVAACFRAIDMNGKTYFAKPIFTIQNASIQPIESEIKELGVKFVFWKIHTNTNQIEISISENKSKQRDFIVMEATIFPGINILWMGCIIMIIGTLIAMRDRIKQYTAAQNASEQTD